MTNRDYLEDQDAEEPDDFIISLTAQVSVLILCRCFFVPKFSPPIEETLPEQDILDILLVVV